MESGGNSVAGNKLMLVLLFLVSLVSVVAIIVAAVSLTNSDSDTPSINVNSGSGGSASASGGSSMPIVINSGSGGSGAKGKRIFKFAMGHDYGGHEYLNEQGYIQGFMKDLALGVCEAGGMDCRLIWDEYKNCWDSEVWQHGVGGKGLYNGWYDACSGWLPTVGRVQFFDFSLPFMKMPTYYIFVLKNNTNFDATDVTGMTFGFLDGYAGDEKCLARQTSIKGSTLPADQIIHIQIRQDLVNALKNGEVDALFGNDAEFHEFDDVRKASGAQLNCAIQGYAMMTTKDNDFNSYWNAGFQKFRDSGKFRKLCEQAPDLHGHKGILMPCVDSP